MNGPAATPAPAEAVRVAGHAGVGSLALSLDRTDPLSTTLVTVAAAPGRGR